MRKTINNKGFTLIEVILSLIIVGFISAVAGLGIIKTTEGFMFTKDAVAVAQKGQLAMTRLIKEFNVISDVNSATADSLGFSSYKLGTKGNHTVSKSGSTLLLDGDILTDTVNTFALAFYESYSDTTAQTTWDGNQNIIEITLTLNGPDGTDGIPIPATFSKKVIPRNLGK